MLITFKYIAFNLLSTNYHNTHHAARRRRSVRLLFCVIVIAFLILEVKRANGTRGFAFWVVGAKQPAETASTCLKTSPAGSQFADNPDDLAVSFMLSSLV